MSRAPTSLFRRNRFDLSERDDDQLMHVEEMTETYRLRADSRLGHGPVERSWEPERAGGERLVGSNARMAEPLADAGRGGGVMPYGAVSRSGIGDGAYEVATMSDQDAIIAIRIDLCVKAGCGLGDHGLGFAQDASVTKSARMSAATYSRLAGSTAVTASQCISVSFVDEPMPNGGTVEAPISFSIRDVLRDHEIIGFQAQTGRIPRIGVLDGHELVLPPPRARLPCPLARPRSASASTRGQD